MATSFEGLHILKEAEGIADNVWKDVLRWDRFVKDVVGKQLTRACDSIGANVAESYGRYHIEYYFVLTEELFSHDDLNWLLTYPTELSQSPIVRLSAHDEVSNLQSLQETTYDE